MKIVTDPVERKPPRDFRPEPFAYHEEITVEISSLTNEGTGVGRLNGWVVMVPFTLPGEKVRARIWRNYKNYSDADLLELLVSSSHRVVPRCELFGVCGGCQYQHLTYEQQLLWKTRQIKEGFKRQTGVEIQVNPAHRSPRQYGYRSKITPHFQKPKKGKPTEIGFKKNDSRRIVDIPRCPIATEAINETLPREREMVNLGLGQYRRGGTLLLRDTLDGVVTDHNAVVSEKVGDSLFQFQAGEFFQNNPFILADMVEHVVKETQGEGIRFLVDAYCGVGVFCISAAPNFERVTGIEISAIPIHWANANAMVNNINNAEFIVGQAENVFTAIDFAPEATAVVIDPPRKGCESAFLNQLVTYAPMKVVYVSCDPATQARDLAIFINNGYNVSCVQPFDLFPQTRHIENVVTLVKKI